MARSVDRLAHETFHANPHSTAGLVSSRGLMKTTITRKAQLHRRGTFPVCHICVILMKYSIQAPTGTTAEIRTLNVDQNLRAHIAREHCLARAVQHWSM